MKFILLDFYLFVWFVWLFCFKGRMVCHMHKHIPKHCKWTSLRTKFIKTYKIFSVFLDALSLVRSSNVYSGLHFVCILLDGTNNKCPLVSSWDDHFTLFTPSFFILFPSSLPRWRSTMCKLSLTSNQFSAHLFADERSGRKRSLGASTWKRVLSTFTSHSYAPALRHELKISIRK